MKQSICDALTMFKRIREQAAQLAPESEPPRVESKPEAPTIAPPTIEDVAGPGFKVIVPGPTFPKPVGNFWVQWTEVNFPPEPYYWPGNAARLWFAIAPFGGAVTINQTEIANGNPVGVSIYANIELQQFHRDQWGTFVTQFWWIHSPGVASFTIVEGIQL